MKMIITITIVTTLLFANPFKAYNLRRANGLASAGLVEQAQQLYRRIEDKRAVFNSAYSYSLAGQYQEASDKYKQYLSSSDVDNKLKARAYLNLGNLALESGDIEHAKTYYREGLLLDSSNYKLKYNLELANQMEVEQQQSGESADETKDNQQQEQAERILNALAQREREQSQLEKTREDTEQHVEKNW